MTTSIFSRGLRARSASAFAACVAALLAADAAHAQITYGWKYQDTAGFGIPPWARRPGVFGSVMDRRR